jgi:hypothetical protein
MACSAATVLHLQVHGGLASWSPAGMLLHDGPSSQDEGDKPCVWGKPRAPKRPITALRRLVIRSHRVK